MKAHGKHVLPVEIYEKLLTEMDKYKKDIPPIELLIAGFDDQGIPHIFTIDWSEYARPWDDLGFWAIGSGATNAITMLCYRNAHPNLSLNDCLYFTFEAKWPGHEAPEVGPLTDIRVAIGGDAYASRASDQDIIELRRIYDELKPSPLLPRHHSAIDNMKVVEETKARIERVREATESGKL